MQDAHLKEMCVTKLVMQSRIAMLSQKRCSDDMDSG